MAVYYHCLKKRINQIKRGIDKANATIKDIAENPKNLVFDANYEPKLLPEIYNNEEGDIVVINSNYAIDYGLNPMKDAIAIEDSKNHPYVNIVAVRKGDENKEPLKHL